MDYCRFYWLILSPLCPRFLYQCHFTVDITWLLFNFCQRSIICPQSRILAFRQTAYSFIFDLNLLHMRTQSRAGQFPVTHGLDQTVDSLKLNFWQVLFCRFIANRDSLLAINRQEFIKTLGEFLIHSMRFKPKRRDHSNLFVNKYLDSILIASETLRNDYQTQYTTT